MPDETYRTMAGDGWGVDRDLARIPGGVPDDALDRMAEMAGITEAPGNAGTVWVMTIPAQGGGRYVHAVFGSEALAEAWAAGNPTVCAGAQWEPFAVHPAESPRPTPGPSAAVHADGPLPGAGTDGRDALLALAAELEAEAAIAHREATAAAFRRAARLARRRAEGTTP